MVEVSLALPGSPTVVAPASVTAVFVTYGSRWHLLREAVEAVQASGVGRVIVVDNGASCDVASQCDQRFGPFVRVIRQSRNEGSAIGFTAGLFEALECGGECVLLLDDDNIVSGGAVSALCNEYNQHVASVGRDNLVVVGFRPARQRETVAGRNRHASSPRASSILGFSVVDIPMKIWRHATHAPMFLPAECPPTSMPLLTCSYGGMFFHSDVIRKFGVPDERFVLYADDTEYSDRITRGGGTILLITNAGIRDADGSWNADGLYSNAFVALLDGADDARVYYSVRNNVYLSRCVRPCDRFVFSVNRYAFLGILWLLSIVRRRRDRYRLLRRAIADGEEGRLGVCVDFPLR